jgi:hypothetical protein
VREFIAPADLEVGSALALYFACTSPAHRSVDRSLFIYVESGRGEGRGGVAIVESNCIRGNEIGRLRVRFGDTWLDAAL